MVRTFGDEASSTVDTGRVELNELQILQRKTSTSNHGISVSGACVCARAAEVRSSISTSSEYSLVCPESVQGTVLHVKSDDTHALAILHNQVQSEVLNEEVGVVSQRLAVEGMKECVSCSVSGSSATICLATLAKLQRLATEGTLIDLALLGS